MDATLPALIEQMLQPQFYPHPVVEPIKLIQTHISYVLLTGDYAYKVKKPANFGFLDFSTLSQRHHFCQEELRLNRRLCPELYLTVLPIAQTASGGFQINPGDDSSEIVEYTIQMRQFDQECLFSHLFSRGELTIAQMQNLGKLLAQFHATAHTDAAIAEFGTVAAVNQVADNSYNLSQAFIGRSQTQSQFEQTKAFSDRFFADHSDWFGQRQFAGKICECHGDLHLNNICLYQDQIQIFDCIEFNQEFRNIDVIYDAAFLVMDLQFQGRGDLANAFLNAYLEWTGDYWGAVLLPLYLSMRAYIRGNVNSLALNDPGIPSTEKEIIQERAAAYFRLAWQYTQPQPGQLWVMSGLSGSGKTTVARQLAQATGAIHLRSDAVRKHLAGLPLDQRGDQGGEFGSGIYTPEMTQKTYDRLLELGLLLAGQGFTVIMDGKYDRQSLRQTVLNKAETHKLPVKFLHCTAPLEVIESRLNQRTGDIADATAKLISDQLKAFEPFTPAEAPYLATLQTNQDLRAQLHTLGIQ
uniref:gluconokinase n=1 Tax=Cyanothece sp. (strain PCC 7425 / ATCC 29141) TaxID=395961 RepID=B8HKD5_CYAP4